MRFTKYYICFTCFHYIDNYHTTIGFCLFFYTSHITFSIVGIFTFPQFYLLLFLYSNGKTTTKSLHERNSLLTYSVITISSSVFIIVNITTSHNSTSYYTKLFSFHPLLLGMIPTFVSRIISEHMLLFSKLTRVAAFHFLII